MVMFHALLRWTALQRQKAKAGEAGETLVEYSLMVVLVGVVCLAALMRVSSEVNAVVHSILSPLSG